MNDISIIAPPQKQEKNKKVKRTKWNFHHQLKKGGHQKFQKQGQIFE